jgi:hypothetical protein
MFHLVFPNIVTLTRGPPELTVPPVSLTIGRFAHGRANTSSGGLIRVGEDVEALERVGVRSDAFTRPQAVAMSRRLQGGRPARD